MLYSSDALNAGTDNARIFRMANSESGKTGLEYQSGFEYYKSAS